MLNTGSSFIFLHVNVFVEPYIFFYSLPNVYLPCAVHFFYIEFTVGGIFVWNSFDRGPLILEVFERVAIQLSIFKHQILHYSILTLV